MEQNTNSSSEGKEILSLRENISLVGGVPPRNIHLHPSKDGAKAENGLASHQSGISTAARVTRPPMLTVRSSVKGEFSTVSASPTCRVLLWLM